MGKAGVEVETQAEVDSCPSGEMGNVNNGFLAGTAS